MQIHDKTWGKTEQNQYLGVPVEKRRTGTLDRKLKAEVTETLLPGCVTRTLRVEHFALLRTAQHEALLRIIGFKRRLCTDHATLSNAKALEMTR